MFDDKSILITGGTGSFGKQYTKTLLQRYSPRRVVIYSRDEFKQFEMSQTYSGAEMRYFIGDVRDENRLDQAMNGIDYVVHAAAPYSRLGSSGTVNPTTPVAPAVAVAATQHFAAAFSARNGMVRPAS